MILGPNSTYSRLETSTRVVYLSMVTLKYVVTFSKRQCEELWLYLRCSNLYLA